MICLKLSEICTASKIFANNGISCFQFTILVTSTLYIHTCFYIHLTKYIFINKFNHTVLTTHVPKNAQIDA